MTNVYDIDVSPESPELLELAKNLLRETPENREKGFKELRELLKQNPDLNYKDDEAFLTIILRCCHWYAEGAIKLVSFCYQWREIPLSSLSQLFNLDLVKVTKSGSKVHLGAWTLILSYW